MSILGDLNSIDITEFRGARTSVDVSDVPPNTAIEAVNITYTLGGIRGRNPFLQVPFGSGSTVPTIAATAMYNWQPSHGNYLATYENTGTVTLSLISSTGAYSAITASITAGAGATFASAGARLFAASFTSALLGAGSGYVITYTGSSHVADTCFKPPLSTTGTLTEPAAGVVTAGAHNFGYIIEYRSGFFTRPSPVNGTTGVFTPQSITAAGSKNVRYAIDSTSFGAACKKIHIVMTTVDNPYQYYFVPGASASVTNAVQNFDVSISDSELSATATNANPYLDLLTQTVGNVAPFNPSVVVQLGTRMGYVTRVIDVNSQTEGALYISDSNDYEHITADQHLVQLPGKKTITTACQVGGGSVYIFGPHWTYQTTDAGATSTPVNWPTPRVVDGSKGTMSPTGVDVATTGDYAWVADQSGLYLLAGGQYSPLPISYYQREWGQINWNAAHTIKVKDDPTRNRVVVIAPLLNATTPNYMMVWDYSRGKSPETVDFSLDSINAALGQFGSVEIVQNDIDIGSSNWLEKRIELWVGTITAAGFAYANVMRQCSDTEAATATGDAGSVLNSVVSYYRTGPLPPRGNETPLMLRHFGFDVEGTNGGTGLSVVAYGFGDQPQIAGTVIPLAAKIVSYRFYTTSEYITYRISGGSASSTGWTLTSLKHYYNAMARQR